MNKRLVATIVLVTLLGCAQTRHSDKTEAQIKAGAAPAGVTAAFQKDHPNVMIKSVVKETYKDGTIHYEYVYIDSSGKQQTVEYSAAGEQL